MRRRLLLLSVAVSTVCLLAAGAAQGARQTVAFFPLQNLSDNAVAADVSGLGQALKEKLQDRLDVRTVTLEGVADPALIRKKARGIGATYVLTGGVSRIGRAVTLDLTLAATEDPGKGRTVVVTGIIDETVAGAGLPPAYSLMAADAAAKLKSLFFGDDLGAQGAGRKIPKLAGTISWSRNLSGDVISVAWTDTDRDGKKELVAALTDGIAIYRVDGDDLVEKARIADSAGGFVHVDAADVNRNGSAEIIAVRYVAGKALSDIWEYDGTGYQRIARDIPYFLRTLDLGKDGIVIAGQESDPVEIFKGPIYRMPSAGTTGGGQKGIEKGPPLPLPAGTWVYTFTTLKLGDRARYVGLGDRDRLVLLDETGKKVWEGVDSVSGTETALEAPVDPVGRLDRGRETKKVYLPNRLFGIDLDGDGNDELVVLNNLVTAGGFFENLRVFSNAEALCFAQEGDALNLLWRTQQAGASSRDAFVDLSGAGQPLRIGVASVDKGKLLGRFGEWRVLWMK